MMRRLLIANRGEIALRIMRTAAEMNLPALAVAAEDDIHCLHARRADRTVTLAGLGAAAYLDAAQTIRIAREHGCDAIHPGYGFLSESAAFARSCGEAGIRFVGPTPEQLDLLGDKARARALAVRCGVPVLAGSERDVTLDEAREFLAAIGHPVMIKAVAGGGGRGIRLATTRAELDAAWERCRSEARAAFGDERVYVEQALMNARHVEVQMLGDGSGRVAHLGERDCTVQRRHQKLLEITPSPALSPELLAALLAAAMRMAADVKLLNAATFEFLVDTGADVPGFHFIEANPRLQVEHTITEERWGVDIVRAQLLLADGMPLSELALPETPRTRGFVVQARINAERLSQDGTPMGDGGVISDFAMAGGPGVRVDGCGYRGYEMSTAFDSLLAKLVVHCAAEDFAAAARKTDRALAECSVQGVTTNIGILRAILTHPDFVANAFSTRFVDEHLADLLARAAELVVVEPDEVPAGAGCDTVPTEPALPDGVVAVAAALTGSVVAVEVEAGARVHAGQQLVVIESMKMEHLITAPCAGSVERVLAAPGDAVSNGQRLLTIIADGQAEAAQSAAAVLDLEHVRPDLAEVLARQAAVLDAGRPDAVARRHARGGRTARENIEDLCDPGTFIEHGSLVIAAQRARRSVDELIRKTPADGVVVGFGNVNGAQFGAESAQSLVVAFDETVLAGTMGEMCREKLKHAFEIARQARRPVVLFAEGGGGRAGDTDGRVGVTGWSMDVSSYFQLARMSALTPLVGITSGKCFAANAGLLACCDVIIATRGSNIGVAGPSMIEGGRLGQYTPEEIGPVEVQSRNGVVDILVDDEAAAVAVARKYLSYFQGPLATWEARDQRAARFVVPENRLRGYRVRDAIDVIADTGTVLELRERFGVGMITALIRVEGRTLGVIANNPLHLGGAVDSDGADKACRFMGLCEAFGVPILFLCDTPGMMVGPQAEATGTVRKMGRMFVTGASLTVPFFTIVLRKAYGLGAELMTGGWFRAPRFVVSWPTGEFGGMNIEGNVKLAHAAELAAIEDPAQRQARFEELVAGMHATGRALAVATHCEVDNVIDPADSRRWISAAMATHRPRLPGSDRTIPFVDPW